MRFFAVTTLLLSTTFLAQAETFNVQDIARYNEDISGVEVETLEGKHWDNYKWELPQTQLPVFLNKIKTLHEVEYEDWSVVIQNPDPAYQGLKVTVELFDGTKLDPMFVFDGAVKSNDTVLLEDPNRTLEYWFYSVNPSATNRKIAARALPIFTYKHCVAVGNPVIYTNPEQCLMANQEIFLNVPEKPTQAALEVTTFDECLTQGEALIDTFPRRCIMAGGHVFTEPPRVFTPPEPKRVKRFRTEEFGTE